MFRFAVSGDIQAARLYFKMVGSVGSSYTTTNQFSTQHNFIQINGLTISQETLSNLDSRTLKEVESAMATVIKRS